MSAPSTTEVRWRCCAFDALAVAELDAIYRARQQVFEGSVHAEKCRGRTSSPATTKTRSPLSRGSTS